MVKYTKNQICGAPQEPNLQCISRTFQFKLSAKITVCTEKQIHSVHYKPNLLYKLRTNYTVHLYTNNQIYSVQHEVNLQCGWLDWIKVKRFDLIYRTLLKGHFASELDYHQFCSPRRTSEKQDYILRNWFFATNSDSLTPKHFQTNVGYLDI